MLKQNAESDNCKHGNDAHAFYVVDLKKIAGILFTAFAALL